MEQNKGCVSEKWESKVRNSARAVPQLRQSKASSKARSMAMPHQSWTAALSEKTSDNSYNKSITIQSEGTIGTRTRYLARPQTPQAGPFLRC